MATAHRRPITSAQRTFGDYQNHQVILPTVSHSWKHRQVHHSRGYAGDFLPTAVFVLPPCWVTLGRHLIFIAPIVKLSSVALLDQTYASPGPRRLIFSGVKLSSAALALCICFSPAGD